MTDNINIKVDTKSRLKSLFHNLTYNLMLDKLIWSNYCLKYIMMSQTAEYGMMTLSALSIFDKKTNKMIKTPKINYIENYKKSNSKTTSIKIDSDNKETLDDMREALYKSNNRLSWKLGNPDPNKKRTYFYVFEEPTLIKAKKSYDHIINELIDNYKPFSNIGFRDAHTAFNNSSIGNQIRHAVNKNYYNELTTLTQEAHDIEIIERFSTVKGVDNELDDDEYYEHEYNIPNDEVLKNQNNLDSIFTEAELEASKQHQF